MVKARDGLFTPRLPGLSIFFQDFFYQFFHDLIGLGVNRLVAKLECYSLRPKILVGEMDKNGCIYN